MPGALHIGIDISGRENVARFMDEDGNEVRPAFEFTNDQIGLDFFLDKLTTLAEKRCPKRINIGMEATGF